ncbi:MAG: AMP-binding protein, partial [Anaerolineae bacterium]
MLVQDFLQSSAERFPDKVALVCDGQRLSYAEIEARANRLAHALIDHGVHRGDRVALYLPNSVEAVVAIFSILKAGATFVVVNPTTKRDKLTYILNNCRAAGLMTSHRRKQLAETIREDVPSIEVMVLSGSAAPS